MGHTDWVGSCEKLLLLSPMLVPMSWSPLSAMADTPWYRTWVARGLRE